MRIIGLFALALILSACSTSPEKDEGKGRQAAETNTALGRSYMDRQQYEIALEKLKRALAHDPTYAPAHTLLGVLYETIGENDLAGNEFKLGVKYDPTDGMVNNNYGAFLCRNDREKEADLYFQAAIRDPFYATPGVAYSNAGSCALAADDLDKAEAYLRKSLEFDDKSPDSLLAMAEVSYRKSSFLRARAFMQRYEAVGPKTEESLSLGFRIESNLGDQASAERYRQELARRYPDAQSVGGSANREQ